MVGQIHWGVGGGGGGVCWQSGPSPSPSLETPLCEPETSMIKKAFASWLSII